MSKPLLIAHRGDITSFSENTLEAFQSAFQRGADGVEMDIHFHNGEIIIVHDYLFDRRSVYPKLGEVLEAIHSKGRIEIEVKTVNIDILRPLKEILTRFPDTDFELTTSEIPLAPRIKQSFPSISLGLILHSYFFQEWMTQEIVRQKLVGWGKLSVADRLHIPLKVLDQFGKGSLVRELQNEGFAVHTHIYDSEEQKEQLALITEWGVDQCTFDNIGLLEVRESAKTGH